MSSHTPNLKRRCFFQTHIANDESYRAIIYLDGVGVGAGLGNTLLEARLAAQSAAVGWLSEGIETIKAVALDAPDEVMG